MRPTDTVLHPTSALCPDCLTITAARVVARDGDVRLQGSCRRHGDFDELYYRNAALYAQLHRLRTTVTCCPEFDCALGHRCSRRATRTMIFMMNVTNHCNLACAACLAGSRAGVPALGDPRRMLAALPDVDGLGFAPQVVFFGGEPTLHPELPRLVREARARGYVPRVATNGLTLGDAEYAQRLAGVGLRWVFLHFDSVDDERNRRLRGRPMREICERAIQNAQAAGMKVQLGTTVSRDNLDEIGGLLEFARRAGVFWISLYPLAEVARTGATPPTYLGDVVEALRAQTGGRVGAEDFVAAARTWARLHRVTGRHNYRQKPTMVSLPLVRAGDAWLPVSRLAGLAAFTSPRAVWRLARSVPNLLDYEHRNPTGETLVLSIQQFQGRRAFDLQEATQSLMSYADDGSFVPFDMYNHVHRHPTP